MGILSFIMQFWLVETNGKVLKDEIKELQDGYINNNDSNNVDSNKEWI